MEGCKWVLVICLPLNTNEGNNLLSCTLAVNLPECFQHVLLESECCHHDLSLDLVVVDDYLLAVDNSSVIQLEYFRYVTNYVFCNQHLTRKLLPAETWEAFSYLHVGGCWRIYGGEWDWSWKRGETRRLPIPVLNGRICNFPSSELFGLSREDT